ncbi:MAG: ribosomal protein S18-alanine N-acetyltransferase [Nocardioides sp.]
MTLRGATVEDVPAVVALEVALFGPDAWSEAQVLEELAGERRQAWVVGEPVLGYAVTLAAGDVLDLQRIAVHPDQQRQGLARRLLDEAVAAGKAARLDRMLLEVSAANSAALAFYAAAGFVEIDRRRRYYRDGTDAVVMRLPLASAACGGRG